MMTTSLILAPVLFAFAHAYMGKTIPKVPYPKKGRDLIAYAIMALALAPFFGWWAAAFFLAFWLMFAPSPARRFPWLDVDHWMPDGRKEPAKRTLLTLFCRYTWGSIPIAALYAYLVNPFIAIALPPAIGALMALGYWIGVKINIDGDMEGKLASGALLGAILGLTCWVGATI